MWAIRNQSPIIRHYKYLEHSQFFPKFNLLDIQWKRLRNIINYAYYYNTYYNGVFKRVGFEPNDLRTPEDIKELPILSKADIRKQKESLLSKGYAIDKLYCAKTGGSTGIPLTILRTKECMELKKACALRHNQWAGWRIGEPIGAVWGNPKKDMSLKGRLRSLLFSPVTYLDTMNLCEAAVVKFAGAWGKMKPTLLFGHAHSLFLLATFVRQLKIHRIKPKTVISTSMLLMPKERSTIEDVFGVKVFDRYGCEEVSLIASECEKHEGMHLNIDHLFIEFVKADGTYANPGEEGSIVVTDLLSTAMPLIRYNVEDVGVPSERICSCGRGLPLMERVVGRRADYFVRKDGGLVSGISLIERTLTAVPGIKQMQLIQESIDKFDVNIVIDSNFTSQNREDLTNRIKQVFGENIGVKFNYLDRIQQEKSGKYRFSKSTILNKYMEDMTRDIS